jgi:hypothetical protein
MRAAGSPGHFFKHLDIDIVDKYVIHLPAIVYVQEKSILERHRTSLLQASHRRVFQQKPICNEPKKAIE